MVKFFSYLTDRFQVRQYIDSNVDNAKYGIIDSFMLSPANPMPVNYIAM
jgi:hypothetical protein